MNEILIFLLIIWLHFISDFLLQSDIVATRKSDSIWILLYHSFVYSLLFIFIGFQYAIVNGLMHFLVDLYTSQITKYYHIMNNRRMFFVTIGADQAMHMSLLILTYEFFIGF